MTAELIARLREWAQNEEMVDQHFTQHGRDCYEVGSAIRDLRAERDALLECQQREITERDARIKELEQQPATAVEWNELVQRLVVRLAAADAELENERLRLAACGVPYARYRIPTDSPSYSASLSTVYDLVDRLCAVETNCDPAGMVRENVLVGDENLMLRKSVELSEARLIVAERALEEARELLGYL